MAIEILMPALSPTMSEGKLSRWMKKEGDTVEAGDVLAEIETDKATMEMEAADEGVLGKILVPDGTDGVAVNQLIGLIQEEDEDDDAFAEAVENAGSGASKSAPTEDSSAPAKSEPAAKGEPRPQRTGAADDGGGKAPPAPTDAKGNRIFASPLARRIAANNDLDLTALEGSGPRGRIVRRDVDAALEKGVGRKEDAKAQAKAAAGPAAPSPAAAEIPDYGMAYDEQANSTMRKTIAKRLVQAKRDIPHFYLTVDCNIDALMDLRAQLNGRSPEGEGAYKLSVNDFVVRAVALALRKVPAANATWTDEAIRLYRDVDVAVAVATEGGLITPVLRKADTKGLAALSNEMRALAKKAREGKLMPEEYQGGGFTVSNLGMYGIRDFSAIINPPQSCILAVGAAEQRPVVKDGALAVATMMTCTLSVDHRSVDGAVGAQFLAAFKAIVEDPLTMML